MARIITITSGKGGVGKTGISLNLSLALAAVGFRVCLFDADLGLANVGILTGIHPDRDLASVISGQFGINDILIRNYQGVDILPGSSGVEQMADLTRTQTGTLISAFLDLETYDYLIFDTSAGISSQVLAFCMASHEIVLVVTTEPTSLTDAYAMLKALSRRKYEGPVKVVVNQVKTGRSARTAYARLKQTVRRFLDIRLEPLGVVAWDKSVTAAVIAQTPFFMLFPDSPASQCIQSIADRIIQDPEKNEDMPIELFWSRCLSFMEKAKASKTVIGVDSEPSLEGAGAEVRQTVGKVAGMEAAPPPAAESEIRRLLENMAAQLSDLTREVADIRRLLSASDPSPEPARPEPRPVDLDFESWLEKKWRLKL